MRGFPGAEWEETRNVTAAQHLRFGQAETNPAAAVQDRKAEFVFSRVLDQALGLEWTTATVSTLLSGMLNITQEHVESRASAPAENHSVSFDFTHEDTPANQKNKTSYQDVLEWMWKFCRVIAGHTRPTKRPDDYMHRARFSVCQPLAV